MRKEQEEFKINKIISACFGLTRGLFSPSIVIDAREKSNSFNELVTKANYIYNKDMRDLIKKEFEQSPLGFWREYPYVYNKVLSGKFFD